MTEVCQQKIKEPAHASEFEVHAYVWSELRKIGINARGEVKVPYMDGGNRRATCRFDIAVFTDGFLCGIVEVKSRIKNHRTEAGWLGTRQGYRYSKFGVPTAIIYGQAQAEKFIAATIAAGHIVW